MDWFERLTGFRETDYEKTGSRLEIVERRLRSRINGASYGIGELELVSLQTLRERAQSVSVPSGRLKASIVSGDVRRMHRMPENAGALFQVASQFNLLEMVSPDVTPEDGVTRYQSDPTQGPACAIAAGAATIYRNYFAPVAGSFGQTATNQLDGLADLGSDLSAQLGQPVSSLWTMKNGYALASESGLNMIAAHLGTLNAEQIESLRGKLCIGVHRDVEATEVEGSDRPVISQAFCSALPVAYCPGVSVGHWEPFASLVLEAAYEATMWEAVLNMQRGASNIVLLTLLGGGVFGNQSAWIYSAMQRALTLVAAYDLDVRLVSYGVPSKDTVASIDAFR